MAYEVNRILTKITVPIALFGIIGNSLVIISILRRRSLLTSNYYFLVLNLAICDGTLLVLDIMDLITQLHMESFTDTKTFCLVIATRYFLAEAGGLMMLIISILRYRASAYPLKIPMSKRRLKMTCVIVYIASFILGYVLHVPYCTDNHERNVILKIQRLLLIFGFFLCNLAIAVIYYRIARVLHNQRNKFIISQEQNAVTSSFIKQRYRRNRKIFCVCCMTFIFYTIGHTPMAIAYLLHMIRYHTYPSSTFYIARLLRIFGLHAINPLIYGLEDRKLLIFWRNCRRKKANVCQDTKIETKV